MYYQVNHVLFHSFRVMSRLSQQKEEIEAIKKHLDIINNSLKDVKVRLRKYC